MAEPILRDLLNAVGRGEYDERLRREPAVHEIAWDRGRRAKYEIKWNAGRAVVSVVEYLPSEVP